MEELFKMFIRQIGFYHLGASVIYLWNKLSGRKKAYKEIIDSKDYLDDAFLYWIGLIIIMIFAVLIAV